MAQQTLNTPREATHQRIADALEDIVDKIVDTSSADNIDYDNTTSGLSANKVQSAIDELALAGFVTNTVNNLVNYYLKSETYNKTEVDSLINAVKNSRFEAVSTLPTTNIKTNVIYLVPKSPTQTNNAKDEYINLDGTSSGWEKIGDTEVDLSGYVTTTALNTALSNYTTTANLTKLLDDKVDKVSGKGLSTNDYTDTEKQKLSGIEAEANKTVVDSAMSDSSTNPLQNKVITKELEGAKTATGNPLTVSDAAPVNAVNLSMDLEPIQDLHGYDHPWVGGAGKNKSSINDCNASASTDLSTQPISIGSERNYTISMKLMRINGVTVDNPNLYAFRVNEYDSTDTIINIINSNVQYLPDNIEVSFSQTVTLDSNTAYIVITYGNYNGEYNINTHKYDIQAEEGSTATSFAPYSNICPISGRSEVAINRVGKNLCYSQVNNTDIATLEAGTYTLSYEGNYAFNLDVMYDGDTSWTRIAAAQGVPYTFTLAKKGTINLNAFSNNISHIQVELGSTATTYEPYAGKTYTIQIGQDVYGAQYDVTRGKMVVDKGYASLMAVGWSHNSGWNNPSAFVNGNGILDGAKSVSGYDVMANAITDAVVVDTPSNIAGYVNRIGIGIGAGTDVFLSLGESYDNVEKLQTYLTNNPIHICYELATPYTIDLTPQQIKMLENTNTIYTDYEGDTITIEYQPNNAIGEAVRVVEESYDAIIQNLLERIEALENNE